MKPKNVLILGAAGRDFHNFNMYFRDKPQYKVVGFTFTQLEGISRRSYPAKLAGKLYPKGIPIYSEKQIKKLIHDLNVDLVVFSYSDVSHEYVMHRASLVLAEGTDFMLLGTKSTQLKSKKPVISVCAVRTGCGKGTVVRYISKLLKDKGLKVVVVRHPMPYADFSEIYQRFASREDLERSKVTFEEREEFEPHIDVGNVVYAGVDFKEVLMRAEKEADVIIWDGGNNDFPFIRSDLNIVLVDPFRAGDELTSYPGETNLRMADIVVVAKENTAKLTDIRTVVENSKRTNPRAKIVHSNLKLSLHPKQNIRGKKVLIVEDGPTITHGGLSEGAGAIMARRSNAIIVNPRRCATGTVESTLNKFPHIKQVLPAMGYSKRQVKDLEETINCAKADYVLVGTPIDLNKVMKLNKPTLDVKYVFEEKTNIIKRAVFKLLKHG